MFISFAFSLQLSCTFKILKRMLLDLVNRAKHGPGRLNFFYKLSMLKVPSVVNIIIMSFYILSFEAVFS